MPGLAAPLKAAARSAAQIDRSKIAFDVGLRATVGVGICLVVGRASGHTLAGVTAGIGALNAGMASHQGTYRSRAGVVLAAAVAMGFCAALGATVGHLLGADIVVTGALAFVAALLVSLGPSGASVGLQAMVVLIVFSQFHFSALVAARTAGLVVLGGAVQVLLVVLVWPLRRFPAERRALSSAYGALARYCRSAPSDPGALVDLGAFDGLDRIWHDAQPFGGDEIAAHRALAAQSDRLRLELVAVARARTRLDALGEHDTARIVDQVLIQTAAVLDDVAAAVGAGRAPVGWEERRLGFRAARSALRQAGPAALDAAQRVEALSGQLRAVVRLAALPAGFDATALDEALTGDSVPTPRNRSGVKWVTERLATLRSNLTLSSQAFRHAARTSVTVAAAVGLSHAFPYGHEYWLPMTTVLVLRPDFTSTMTRGVARIIGTLIGAGLVTVALAELKPSAGWLIALVVLLCFPATSLVLANYAVFSVCIASLVVTLLAFTGNPELATAGDRTIYTVVGAALALTAYLLWPTWEATSLPDTLAGLVLTEASYAGKVLRAWADPGRADRADLQRARLQARLARGNTEAAVTRWLSEPGTRTPLRPETVLAFMAAVRGCVQASLALHAELPEGGQGCPGAAALAGDLERAFEMVADQVKGSPLAAPFPPLRKEQLELTAETRVAGGTSIQGTSAAVLAGETDLLVDSVDALGHLFGLMG